MKIKTALLGEIFELCKQAFPREVGGLLLNNPVDDFVLLPGKFNRTSINVFTNSVPLYPNLQGTFHSHPSASNNPSGADLDFFRRFGKWHLIIAYPYDLNSVAVYNARGERLKLEVVD